MLTSTAVPPAQMTAHPDSGEVVEGDDSIAKMASALLDDTEDHMRDSLQHIREHHPQARRSKTTPNLSNVKQVAGLENKKAFPEPPAMIFNENFRAHKATSRGINRSLLRDSYESTKEIGRKGKRVLSKMKNSVVDILQGGSPRSGCNSVRDERLLGSSSNESQELDEGQTIENSLERGNITFPILKSCINRPRLLYEKTVEVQRPGASVEPSTNAPCKLRVSTFDLEKSTRGWNGGRRGRGF
jgi:hypothetical protein